MYTAIADNLANVDLHITDHASEVVYSSSLFPDRYRLDNYQNRRDFGVPEAAESREGGGGAPRLFLDPRGEEEGSRIALTMWNQVPGGYIVLDVRNSALWELLDLRASTQAYLVDTRDFRAYHLSQSGGSASFSRNPELGIAFNEDAFDFPEADLLVSRADLAKYQVSMVMTTDLSSYFDALREILSVGALVVVGIALVVVLVAIRVSRLISRPIHNVVHAMSADPSGPQPLPEQTGRRRSDELEQLQLQYNEMVATLRGLIRTVREEEQAQRVAERKALESQIQPHFLYNALGSIKSMAKLGDSEAVTTMVTDLGKMLRFLLSDKSTTVTLAESIDQVRRYLHIQKVRFQERMQVSYDLEPGSLEVVVPKLLVQPLVKNAVIHGVEATTSVVEIRVITARRDGTLSVRVEDTGPGFISAEEASRSSGEDGIGLQNVRDRLRLFYGDRGTLRLARPGDVTIAELEIPV